MAWQPKIGSPGELVEGLDELEQQLRILLETPLSSVPSRPGFGTRIFDYIDLPVTKMRPAVVREVLRTTALNLPTIKVLRIEPTPTADGHVVVALKWQPKDDTTVTRDTTVQL